MVAHRRCKGFTLIELLVVIAIIAILVALLLPAVQAVREAARKSQCQDNLHNLAIAVHNYHDAHKVYPPEFIVGTTGGNAAWGWGSFILPFIEQKPLYDILRPGAEPFPAATALIPATTGSRLLQEPVDIALCPSDGSTTVNPFYPSPSATTGAYAKSSYLCNQQVMPFGGAKRSVSDVTDGTSNVFLFGESRLYVGSTVAGVVQPGRYCGAVFYGRGTVVTSDSQLAFHATLPINTPCETNQPLNAAHTSDARRTRFAISSAHPGGAQFALCDGVVRFVSQNIQSNPAAAANSAASNGISPVAGTFPLGFAGPGWTYQNLLGRDDGYPVGPY